MKHHQIVIVGGGAAGIATAASLLKRRRDLDVAVLEPAPFHYYQPGWTMVGGGIFSAPLTRRSTGTVMPAGVNHIRQAAAEFDPDNNRLTLDDGRELGYDVLVMAPGLATDWDGIPGLAEALGKGGVTSNYRYDLAPYTWKLVQGLSSGKAIFTQPPMPIKCPGAPQKAVYLSCFDWEKRGVLKKIEVSFHTAGPALFSVPDYVPPLAKYMQRYGVDTQFASTLSRIDGAGRTATFVKTDADGNKIESELGYDMLHVVPPQSAHGAVKGSALADGAGFVEVDHQSLRHVRYDNVFGLGDACSTPNSKTAAAARKQAPIVAENVIATAAGRQPRYAYNGYGSCPLTVERGKAILAEFGYGGKLMPSFNWDSTVPHRRAWYLKEDILPWVYWNAMLKGREWMAQPRERIKS